MATCMALYRKSLCNDLVSKVEVRWLETCQAEVHERGVHSHRHDHGQLGWDHCGDDDDASQEELVLGSILVLHTIVEDMS